MESDYVDKKGLNEHCWIRHEGDCVFLFFFFLMLDRMLHRTIHALSRGLFLVLVHSQQSLLRKDQGERIEFH